MTKVKLTNAIDLAKFREGQVSFSGVRSVEIDALVDTGATTLVLPEDVAVSLGLPEIRRVRAGMADGTVRSVPIVGDLRIEIVGRDMGCDALVMPAGTVPLIGQIPLEFLDLVVHPRSGELVANPASPEQRVYILNVA